MTHQSASLVTQRRRLIWRHRLSVVKVCWFQHRWPIFNVSRRGYNNENMVQVMELSKQLIIGCVWGVIHPPHLIYGCVTLHQCQLTLTTYTSVWFVWGNTSSCSLIHLFIQIKKKDSFSGIKLLGQNNLSEWNDNKRIHIVTEKQRVQ